MHARIKPCKLLDVFSVYINPIPSIFGVHKVVCIKISNLESCVYPLSQFSQDRARKILYQSQT